MPKMPKAAPKAAPKAKHTPKKEKPANKAKQAPKGKAGAAAGKAAAAESKASERGDGKHRAGSIVNGKRMLMTATPKEGDGQWEVEAYDTAAKRNATVTVSAESGAAAVQRAGATIAPHREGKIIAGQPHMLTARPASDGKAQEWDVETFDAVARQTRKVSVSATSAAEAVRAATPTLEKPAPAAQAKKK
mmetsp:Transcript_137151/g.333298  ORF Transcript_137151/g.333298 Transcript_137151/m.333298 type:complete len:190 (-) Transcript_137151:12-581(-)